MIFFENSIKMPTYISKIFETFIDIIEPKPYTVLLSLSHVFYVRFSEAETNLIQLQTYENWFMSMHEWFKQRCWTKPNQFVEHDVIYETSEIRLNEKKWPNWIFN